MENLLLGKMDFDFNSEFSEIDDKKFGNPAKNEDGSTSNNKFVDDQPKSTHDLFSDIDHFSSLTNENSNGRNNFSEADFKYLLSKSSPENDPKKSAKSKKEIEEEERERMQVLVSNFTEEQLDRYEMYRRAAFPKAAIKRIMQVITGSSVSQNVVIGMSGIAKVFVGEIVEEALDIMEAQRDAGPLQPKHLREAARRLRLKGKIPSLRDKKPNYRF